MILDMSKPISLSHFIRNDETQLRLFDMGRRVSKIRLSDFEKFEQAELSYPYPYQQTAWVGLVFWRIKNKDQHNIWFIRMPLDERGFINVASRDEFLDMLLARIGEQITLKSQGESELTHALKDNPYVFKPTEENMAIFHAKAKQILGLPASGFLADMISYLSGDNFEQWQHLGIQGFADVAVRQDNAEVNKLLSRAIEKLPEQPFCALCNALENETCGPELTDSIVKIMRHLMSHGENNQDTVNRLTSSIRSLANTSSVGLKKQMITEVLQSPFANNLSVLVMTTAKCWEALDDNELLTLYLEKLATNASGAKLFNALVADQMFLPGKREQILQIFRSPGRSETLTAAVGDFFKQVSNSK